MKNLIIIGAGGFGREVLTWARDNPASLNEWTITGFLDSRAGILDGFAKTAGDVPDAAPHSSTAQGWYSRDLPILGEPMSYAPREDDVFVCALGAPHERRKYASPIIEKGGRFITLMHPKAEVSVFASIGMGSIIGPFASVSPDVRIGKFAVINSYTGLGHDAIVGDWCTIDGHCLIAGNTTIGEAAQVHGGSVVAPRAEIGRRAVIGAGSVVIGKIPDDVTALGNPARRFDWRGGA